MFRAVALACMSALMMGVLKGSSPVSVIAVSGLCIALVPLGLRVLKETKYPDRRTIVLWSLVVVAAAGFLYFLGQQG
jgi:drug/metabolite transporter (DMT)-like permease